MSKKPAVVYSNVWEDPELNRQSLLIRPTDSVLSITSGGCNSLCLLLEEPQRVVSIDLNPAQLAMLEFKRAAIIELDYEDFLASMGTPFVGQAPGTAEQRLALFDRIKQHLPEYAKDFWQENRAIIGRGIFMCGKVEAFFRFYVWVLKQLYHWEKIEKLFHCPDLTEQRKVYTRLNKRKWRFLNSLLLNKLVLSIVKGAHSFAKVEDHQLATNLSRKIDKGMTNFYNPDNFFMSLMLLGGHYSRKAMSPYLLEENFVKLKNNIGRLEIFQGTVNDVLQKYGPQSFDRLNMSNIFEWMDHDFFNEVISDLLKLSRPGTRMAWRYTLARPRQLNAENQARLIAEEELAQRLFDLDRTFIYESFHVYRLSE